MNPLTAIVAVYRAFPGAELQVTDDDLGGHALAYGLAGQEVLPLRGKVPLIPRRDGGHGVLDATANPNTIATWWTEHPSANIGGRVAAQMLVVDLDPRHGALDALARIEADHGPTATRTSFSGRGDGGRHLWFQHPGGPITGNGLPDGWDLRTRGNYVVLPPSLHPLTVQPYRWTNRHESVSPCPKWLADMLRPRATPFVSPVFAEGRAAWSAAGLIARVAAATEGERNNVLNWAAHRLGQDYERGRVVRAAAQAAADALHEAALQSGLDANEVEQTIRSALRGARKP